MRLEVARQRARHVARHPVQSASRALGHAFVRGSTQDRVRSGPFAGMWYGLAIPHLPSFLGTYERELTPLLDRLRGLPFDLILNVGAADGYYAAGLARLWPDARVIAFELIPVNRENTHRVVERNDLRGRVEVEGVCTVARLQELLGRATQPLVWIDVDGGERELLDPVAVPALAGSDVVVELHEFLVGGISDLLRQRFATTHDIDRVQGERRGFEDFPLRGRAWRSRLGRHAAVEAMQERRPELQDWLYLRPRRVGADAASASA